MYVILATSTEPPIQSVQKHTLTKLTIAASANSARKHDQIQVGKHCFWKQRPLNRTRHASYPQQHAPKTISLLQKCAVKISLSITYDIRRLCRANKNQPHLAGWHWKKIPHCSISVNLAFELKMSKVILICRSTTFLRESQSNSYIPINNRFVQSATYAPIYRTDKMILAVS